MKMVIYIFLLLTLNFLVENVHATNISMDQAVEQVASEMPLYRYGVGGYSLLIGSSVSLQSISVISNERPDDEDRVASMLFAIGLVRVVDGLIQLFDQTQIERDVAIYRSMPKGREREEFFYQKLQDSSRHYQLVRPIRSTLIMATGVGYLYLYAKDSKQYGMLIYPAVVMAGIAFFQLIFPSPSERALSSYQKNKVNVMLLPVNQGAMVGLTTSF